MAFQCIFTKNNRKHTHFHFHYLRSNIKDVTAYRNSWILNARVERCTLDAGRWTLDAGPLDAGRWTLDAEDAEDAGS